MKCHPLAVSDRSPTAALLDADSLSCYPNEHECRTTTPAEPREAHRRAFAEYGARALWNKRELEAPTSADALVVARASRVEGNREARRLAEQIEHACRATLYSSNPFRRRIGQCQHQITPPHRPTGPRDARPEDSLRPVPTADVGPSLPHGTSPWAEGPRKRRRWKTRDLNPPECVWDLNGF